MDDYQKFLATKEHPDSLFGFAPLWLSNKLFDFQRFLVDWAIRKGRCSVFADCGLGKTFLDLVWAENIVRKENKPVLFMCPLAVAAQTIKEGEKFGIECKITRDGTVHKGINVTNYERLHRYDPSKFVAAVPIEASILKNFDGKMRNQITKFLHKVKYRLLETATPCPNDYMELGTHSEALGVMGRYQMLGMFFTNSGDTTQQWELKGHARKRFWRWVCSWARALRKPSDLGFSDDGFILPKMTVTQHVVKRPNVNGFASHRGFGFVSANTLEEQKKERKLTIKERCEKVAELVPKNDYMVVWCHLNDEGDLLEKLIPNSVQVAGKDRDEVKEERLTAFGSGQIKVLITKPKIGGFGLNWQHCNRMSFYPSHSFESFYQSVRRCHRFGQKRPVFIEIVTSEGESRVIANMRRKELAMESMFASLVTEMNEYQLKKKPKQAKVKVEVPSWLR